jgi:hypothetical protein
MARAAALALQAPREAAALMASAGLVRRAWALAPASGLGTLV